MKRRSKMEKTQHLAHLAHRFYIYAEVPKGDAWWNLFIALAERDVEKAEAICKEYNIDTNTDY